MIFISSACLKHDKIKNSVEQLAKSGFNNIELSGGTDFYEGFVDDLLDLKVKYNLNYICHNYFPPPKKHFVINLASMDDYVFENTLNHLQKSINLSKLLNVNKFGFHAGFYHNIPLNQIGKSITKKTLFNKSKSFTRFCNAFDLLKKNNPDIELYLENNVLSNQNFSNFNDNLFMLTTSDEYFELINKIDFKLILDVAHLKVSCNSLNLNFEKQLDSLMCKSDYLHISDNDSFVDQNRAIKKDSNLYSILSKYSLKNKMITLETYESVNDIADSFNLINKLQ